MSWVLWLLAVPVSALVTGGGLRAAGVPRRTAILAGIAAGVITGVALIALWLTAFGQCVAENPNSSEPFSWPWSPRRQFCSDGNSPAAMGGLALLLVPTALVMLGTFLRFMQRPILGWAAYAGLLMTPVLPSLYVNSLPYYLLDSYPVLNQPLLRPASGSRLPRVCFVYGIAFGPRKVEATDATVLDCVDLEPTPEALSLTPGHDDTEYDLDEMGKDLTQQGPPIHPGPTGIDGLIVVHAYLLRDSQARIGAMLVG